MRNGTSEAEPLPAPAAAYQQALQNALQSLRAVGRASWKVRSDSVLTAHITAYHQAVKALLAR